MDVDVAKLAGLPFVSHEIDIGPYLIFESVPANPQTHRSAVLNCEPVQSLAFLRKGSWNTLQGFLADVRNSRGRLKVDILCLQFAVSLDNFFQAKLIDSNVLHATRASQKRQN